MQRIYKRILFIVIILVSSKIVAAQITNDSIPLSVDPVLMDIYKSKVAKEYTISDIIVTGTKAFDANLIVSISGLAVGDKVMIPGTDVFSKAISKLWRQNLISQVQIYFTKLSGRNLSLEIAISERPRLADFKFIGVRLVKPRLIFTY